jgi:hypothetical protein
MGRKHLMTLLIGVAAGYVLAPQIGKLPLVSKLPQF